MFVHGHVKLERAEDTRHRKPDGGGSEVASRTDPAPVAERKLCGIGDVRIQLAVFGEEAIRVERVGVGIMVLVMQNCPVRQDGSCEARVGAANDDRTHHAFPSTTVPAGRW